MPPAVGYSFRILLLFLFRNKISVGYIPRMLILGLINLINFPFRTYERLFINPRFKKHHIENAPVFIIGHWRSGTTHLHNLLSMDKQMGYVTTYQGVFPDTLFNMAGRFLFKNFTRILIPRTRKGDNVILDPDNPQEEEFALGDKVPTCYYYFWMFPKKMLFYYDRFIRFSGLSPKLLEHWKQRYLLMIKKALKNTGRERFLSKNPPNTGRIRVLLEMFPDAKFIFIHRNPVEVFLSTRHFFNKMMPNLQLHNIGPAQLEKSIIAVYKNLMKDYFDQKQMIPEGNLIEIRFDELEQNPAQIAEIIYDRLHIPGFEEARRAFENYMKQTEKYEKNKHRISKSLLDKITLEWQFMMEKYNYQIPDTIDIEDE